MTIFLARCAAAARRLLWSGPPNAMRKPRSIALVLAAACLCAAAASRPASGQEWREGGKIVLRGDVVTMNDTAQVLRGARVVIEGAKITAVVPAGAALPPSAAGAPVVEANGYIFPGLIDAHNHLEYDMIPMWSVPQLYRDMYEWMESPVYEREIKYPKRLLSDPKFLGLQTEIGKYAEVKAISGGTTSIQGSPTNPGYIKHLVRNIEFSNFGSLDRIQQRSMGIMNAAWRGREAPELVKRIAEGKVDAWLVHLAEGTNEAARAEFDLLEQIGLAVPQTAIIHGIALGDAELTKMGQRGMKLIASPLDNYLLYGRTADLPLAKRRGVLISLGSDWSPFGSKNLLTELKVTSELNRTAWGRAFSDLELVRMVTTNPARTLGLQAKIGTVAAGLYADLLVLESAESDPYRALIAATEAQVRLVVIGGEPYYGDQPILQRLKGADHEVVGSPSSKPKAVDITKSSIAKGSQTYAEIKETLTRALETDPTWLGPRLAATRSNPSINVASYIAQQFPLGLGRWHLDPPFAGGDAHYFATLRAARNASFPFDIESFWRPGRAAAIAGVPAGRAALLRAEPKIGPTVARLANGDPITVVAERSYSSGPRWFQVVTRTGLRGWVSALYVR